MAKLVIATTLYPMPTEWTDAFAGGLAGELVPGSEVVAALDGVSEEQASVALKSVSDRAPVHFVTASGSPAAIRLAMLDRVRACAPDAAVLFDADDVPREGAVACHAKVLEQADISFGDMEIVGLDRDSGTFFEGANIPVVVETIAPLDRINFMGLTNTALGSQAISATGRLVPADVIAFDWWLFTSLIDAGCVAKRTHAPVTRYRHRQDGMLGARPNPDPQRFSGRCRMVAAHGRAFPYHAELANYGRKADRAAADVDRDPQAAAADIARACAEPGVWFSDVARFLEYRTAA